MLPMGAQIRWLTFREKMRDVLTRFRWPLLTILVLAVLAAGAIPVWRMYRKDIDKHTRPIAPPDAAAKTATAVPPPASLPRLEDAVRAVQEGRYEDAASLVRDELGKNPRDEGWLALNAWLMKDLPVDFRFHYLPGRRTIVSPAPAAGGLVLTSQDPFYLTVQMGEACYLYVYRLTSGGEVLPVFPSRDIPTPNPVPAGSIRIPDGPNWIDLDDRPGPEKIFLVACRWRHNALEELNARLLAERDPDARKRLADRTLERLDFEGKVAGRWPGLVYGDFQFQHGRPPGDATGAAQCP